MTRSLAQDTPGARYYAPSLGRFMTPDWSSSPAPVPYANLANPQSLNLYSYVLNNPASATDPDGHWCIFGFVGATCTKAKAPPKEGKDTPLPPMPGAPPVSLTAAQDFAPGANQFRPNRQTGATYCNAATLCIAEAAHAPTAPLARSNGDVALADAMAQGLAGSPLYRQVSPGEAQTLANEGQLVIGVWYNASGHGHAVTVGPVGIPGDAPCGRSGPLLNDIGGSDQIARQSGAFPPGATVRYYTPVSGSGH